MRRGWNETGRGERTAENERMRCRSKVASLPLPMRNIITPLRASADLGNGFWAFTCIMTELTKVRKEGTKCCGALLFHCYFSTPEKRSN